MPNVRQLRPRDGDTEDGIDGNVDLRRIVVQVAALLPNDHADAMRVLDITRRFVTEFLTEP